MGAACAGPTASGDAASGSMATTTSSAGDATIPASVETTAAPTSAPPTLPPIAAAVPGAAGVFSRVKGVTDKVALTFDDGYCGECVGTMVAALERTGTHVTFCPNGSYGKVWAPYLDRIRALIAEGQLQICNHTWDHARITGITAAHLTDEIDRNEQWIEDTFGVSSRPFFRPPYGSHNATTDRLAGSLGYTSVVGWSSTLSDSTLQTPETILDQLRTNLVPGGIVLGHLNFPTTGQVFDQILAVLDQRGLTAVTLSELVASGAA
jgi:peptidoglycan/xylan/chitin deacetylase (PgdA/CDA1 family)